MLSFFRRSLPTTQGMCSLSMEGSHCESIFAVTKIIPEVDGGCQHALPCHYLVLLYYNVINEIQKIVQFLVFLKTEHEEKNYVLINSPTWSEESTTKTGENCGAVKFDHAPSE